MAKADRTSSLEREIEATRERLATSIDQLIAQASPKAIAARQARAARGVFVDGDGRLRFKNVAVAGGSVLGVLTLLAVLRRLGRR
jgi:hypothetical protein